MTVATADMPAYRLQRGWAPRSRHFDGCDPGRHTWRAIEAAGFREVLARWYTRGHSRYNPILGGIAHV